MTATLRTSRHGESGCGMRSTRSRWPRWCSSEMVQFGMDQLRRRQEGKISQEQHLQENSTFIKQSAEKRLRLLSERMGKE